MALLPILRYPDPRLRTKAKKVEAVDQEIERIVDDMFETMYDAPGIGLAATQVNIHQQIITIDVSEDNSEPLCLINPQILEKDGEGETEEGCLSVPEYYAKVRRAEKIKIRALDKQGEPFEMEADGLLAICIQHEIDHLMGRVFVDYLSPLKQSRVRKKLEKSAKQVTS